MCYFCFNLQLYSKFKRPVENFWRHFKETANPIISSLNFGSTTKLCEIDSRVKQVGPVNQTVSQAWLICVFVVNKLPKVSLHPRQPLHFRVVRGFLYLLKYLLIHTTQVWWIFLRFYLSFMLCAYYVVVITHSLSFCIMF